MRRREILGAFAAAGVLGASPRRVLLPDCGCAPQIRTASDKPPGGAAFRDVGSKLRITNLQVFGVTLDERIAQAEPVREGTSPAFLDEFRTDEGVVASIEEV